MVKHKGLIDDIQKIGAISGIISIMLYLLAILFFIPNYLEILVGFTFPLLWALIFYCWFMILLFKKDSIR